MKDTKNQGATVKQEERWRKQTEVRAARDAAREKEKVAARVTAKKTGKGKAGKTDKTTPRVRKVAVNESPVRPPVKSIWEEVVDREAQAAKKKKD